MRRLLAIAAAPLLCLALWAPASQAAFGLSEVQMSFSDDAAGAPELKAGAHPFAATNSFEVNTTENPHKPGIQVVDGALRDLHIIFPSGFAGNPTAVARCTTLEFLIEDGRGCPDAAAAGTLLAKVGEEGLVGEEEVAIYNLHPAPGSAAKLGFWVGGVPITASVGLTQTPPYRVIATLKNTTQIVEVLESVATVWGNPADDAHDFDRGACAYPVTPESERCPVDGEPRPFLTMPRSCTGELQSTFSALSWWSASPLDPGPPAFFSQTVASPALGECQGLAFSPDLDVAPTSERAASPSGLEARLDVDDPGLSDPDGRAGSDIRKAVVTLPEGMTINPSQAEGLKTCSESELARESADSRFGAGCPAASKIGTVEVETPLLENETLRGSLFVAEPFENPFGSLLAIYQVIKSPELGIVVKLPGRVEPDSETGQIITTFGGEGTDPLPQLPFSRFRLRFREGGRSPLITPRRCGDHEVKALFTPWAGGDDFEDTSTFEITGGPRGESCPPRTPPFEPGFAAGTLNNAAGAHSPFALRLTRRDGDADLVRFDAALPAGLTARLAGTGRCPDALIALADRKSGKAELSSPSCPLASRIGTVHAGAGAGSQLTYVRGSAYLAGPFAGAPLSVVAIVPAVAGPFDVGTVITRQALRVDPRSAEVLVDGSLSEPIPHILQGIPLAVRDIQVAVDRPAFTLNPTDCSPKAIGAGIWGGGAHPFSLADDSPVARAMRFQAADCARLAFRPRLGLTLKGKTRRGGHPALRTVFRPRPGDANSRRVVVRFPRSAFVEQAHIRTVCTRVQFAASACPKGSIYGRVAAFTPLLANPLRGPVYLRSSNNTLPDLVFDLKGEVDFEAVARIDSVRGALRAIAYGIPDAPISRVVIQMRGGRRGLIVNSRHLCRSKNRASLRLFAHNSKRRLARTPVRALGCKKGKRGRRGAQGGRG